jgi:hypothetical protein
MGQRKRSEEVFEEVYPPAPPKKPTIGMIKEGELYNNKAEEIT